MEKSDSNVQQQRKAKEVVEDIMIKKEVKPIVSSSQQLKSDSVDAMKRKIKSEGTMVRRLKMLFRRSWQNIRHVEAAELDAVFSSESQPFKSNDIKPSVQQLGDTNVCQKKEIQPEESRAQNQKFSQNKPHKTILKKNQKKEEKPQELSPDAMKSLLGGGGYILG